MKDQLFLLAPGFMSADGGPYYCGDSVAVEGMLSFFPQLRERLDVHYLPATRPRAPLVALLGHENQSAPTLVLAEGQQIRDPTLTPRTAEGRAFFDDPGDIRTYLSAQYRLPRAS